jgi:zinc ribbon protein
MSARICEKCGTENRGGANFCSACGASLPLTNFEITPPVKKSSTKYILYLLSGLMLTIAGIAQFSGGKAFDGAWKFILGGYYIFLGVKSS